jgi:hypothetical protein
MPPMISSGSWLPSPLATPKLPSSQPIGSMQIAVTAATMPIGMSCSVRGSDAPCPARRTREAAMADLKPPTTGPMSLMRLQIAAMPMTPAPMKRT